MPCAWTDLAHHTPASPSGTKLPSCSEAFPALGGDASDRAAGIEPQRPPDSEKPNRTRPSQSSSALPSDPTLHGEPESCSRTRKRLGRTSSILVEEGHRIPACGNRARAPSPAVAAAASAPASVARVPSPEGRVSSPRREVHHDQSHGQVDQQAQQHGDEEHLHLRGVSKEGGRGMGKQRELGLRRPDPLAPRRNRPPERSRNTPAMGRTSRFHESYHPRITRAPPSDRCCPGL